MGPRKFLETWKLCQANTKYCGPFEVLDMIGLIALKNRIKECLSDTVFSKTIWLIPWPKEKKKLHWDG
jgi:hypothetical protein